MSGTVRPAVEAIWAALGRAAPPEAIGGRYDFTIDETDMVLRLARNGRTIELDGVLGLLQPEPIRAADQLRRLLRIGLGLAGVNRAALHLPGGLDPDTLKALANAGPGERPALDVHAIARIEMTTRQEVMQAVQDVLQWQQFARPILGGRTPERDDDGPMTRSTRAETERDFVIFQP